MSFILNCLFLIVAITVIDEYCNERKRSKKEEEERASGNFRMLTDDDTNPKDDK